MTLASLPPRLNTYELDGVCKVYGGARPGEPSFTALSDASFTIADAGLVTIVGPSGSGKSTLLGLLGLLDVPSAGQIQIAGLAVDSDNERHRCALRAALIGFVFQSFHLMDRRTVLENVMLGGLYRGLSRSECERQALHQLERVGLEAKSQTKAGTLSGGERQRTAIARSLIGNPEVLLCDEPTGNLDSANGASIVRLLDELNGSGITVVIVTHDQQIAARGTQQILVRDGRVSGDGCR